MGVTLDQILTLSGALDDAPGFDVPRERFRRFLAEHVRDADTLRRLLAGCQHAPDTQHRRALQDLVVFAGRFLGFEPNFGSYTPVDGALTYHGHWRSRARVQVAIEVRTDPGVPATTDTLERAIAALQGAAVHQVLGLVVLPPSYMRRDKLEKAIGAQPRDVPIGVVSVEGLLALAERGAVSRLSHEDVLTILESNLSIDFVVGLLERAVVSEPAAAQVIHQVTGQQRPRATSARDPEPMSAQSEPAFWLAPVAPDHATSPEDVLELVVGRRRVFGLMESEDGSTPRTGDHIYFYIPGRGGVGRAWIASVSDHAGGIRSAHRFRQVLHLDDLDLHVESPVEIDAEIELRLRSALTARPGTSAQILIPISRDAFERLLNLRRRKAAGVDVDTAPASNSQLQISDSQLS